MVVNGNMLLTGYGWGWAEPRSAGGAAVRRGLLCSHLATPSSRRGAQSPHASASEPTLPHAPVVKGVLNRAASTATPRCGRASGRQWTARASSHQHLQTATSRTTAAIRAHLGRRGARASTTGRRLPLAGPTPPACQALPPAARLRDARSSRGSANLQRTSSVSQSLLSCHVTSTAGSRRPTCLTAIQRREAQPPSITRRRPSARRAHSVAARLPSRKRAALAGDADGSSSSSRIEHGRRRSTRPARGSMPAVPAAHTTEGGGQPRAPLDTTARLTAHRQHRRGLRLLPPDREPGRDHIRAMSHSRCSDMPPETHAVRMGPQARVATPRRAGAAAGARRDRPDRTLFICAAAREVACQAAIRPGDLPAAASSAARDAPRPHADSRAPLPARRPARVATRWKGSRPRPSRWRRTSAPGRSPAPTSQCLA